MTRTQNLMFEGVFRAAAEWGDLPVPEPVEPIDIGGPPEECILARMRFDGPVSGELIFAAPPDAEVLMGAVDEDLIAETQDEGTQLTGAIGGLMQAICEGMAGALGKDESDFSFSAPDFAWKGPENWRALLAARGSQAFLVEDTPIVLRLALAN